MKMTENQGTKILLADGTEHTIQYTEVFFVCGICGEEYGGEPMGGYCDETLDCAFDEAEHLIPLPR